MDLTHSNIFDQSNLCSIGNYFGKYNQKCNTWHINTVRKISNILKSNPSFKLSCFREYHNIVSLQI